jgi:hypothetical protein
MVLRKSSPMMTLPKTPCHSISVLRLKGKAESDWCGAYLIVAVEDEDRRGGDGDPYCQALAGAS